MSCCSEFFSVTSSPLLLSVPPQSFPICCHWYWRASSNHTNRIKNENGKTENDWNNPYNLMGTSYLSNKLQWMTLWWHKWFQSRSTTNGSLYSARHIFLFLSFVLYVAIYFSFYIIHLCFGVRTATNRARARERECIIYSISETEQPTEWNTFFQSNRFFLVHRNEYACNYLKLFGIVVCGGWLPS